MNRSKSYTPQNQPSRQITRTWGGGKKYRRFAFIVMKSVTSCGERRIFAKVHFYELSKTFSECVNPSTSSSKALGKFVILFSAAKPKNFGGKLWENRLEIRKRYKPIGENSARKRKSKIAGKKTRRWSKTKEDKKLYYSLFPFFNPFALF